MMRANDGPLSLWEILKRRRVSFERWCETESITTREDFWKVKRRFENQGELFLDAEMTALGDKLPSVMSAESITLEVTLAPEEPVVTDDPTVATLEETGITGQMPTGRKSRKSV